MLQAFAREKDLCALLKDVETAHCCLRRHRAVPAACSERAPCSLEAVLPLVAQQAILLEQAATAGVGGAAKRERAAEEAADFRLFADDASGLCVPPRLCYICCFCYITNKSLSRLELCQMAISAVHGV